MKHQILILSSIISLSASIASAQTATQVDAYISRYKDIAMAEQQRSGVPAAITLAQGIHESGCGASELSTNAHNHFGIKCKSSWTGSTYSYTDDAKDECFRKYESDITSYQDHSDFLKSNVRYAALFALDINDYKGWATGLKKAGYATNPNYSARLVNLIEKYQLQEYTTVALQSTVDSDGMGVAIAGNLPVATALSIVSNAEPEQDVPSINYYENTEKNGLKGFYARRGDLLLNAAYKNNIRYAKLLEINDLADEPLKEDLFIYLEKKNKQGSKEKYVVGEGESLSYIAQETGIRLKELRTMNHLVAGEEPETGAELYLKRTSEKKPLLKAPNFVNNIRREFEGREEQRKPSNVAAPQSDSKIRTKPSIKEALENEVPSLDIQSGSSNISVEKQAEPQRQYETKIEPISKEVVHEKVYNIADEPAVEEQIAEEKAAAIVAEVPEVAAESPAPEMSDLDRLKAKLDRSVYGNKAASKVPSETYSTPVEKPVSTKAAASSSTYETRPARQSSSNQRPTGNAQEELRKKIEANQAKERVEPIVARSNSPRVEAVAKAEKTVAAPKPVVKSTEKPVVKASAKPVVKAKKVAPTAHTVKRGETLTSIAAQYDLDVKQLMKLNKLKNGAIQGGDKLKLK